jgi:hypothetical protein
MQRWGPFFVFSRCDDDDDDDDNCIKARDDLMSMWNSAVIGQAQLQSTTPLTGVEKHRIRVSNPVPENIGCQYASEVFHLYIVRNFDFFDPFPLPLSPLPSIAQAIGKLAFFICGPILLLVAFEIPQ